MWGLGGWGGGWDTVGRLGLPLYIFQKKKHVSFRMADSTADSTSVFCQICHEYATSHLPFQLPQQCTADDNKGDLWAQCATCKRAFHVWCLFPIENDSQKRGIMEFAQRIEQCYFCYLCSQEETE
jgi:hypothetical protein